MIKKKIVIVGAGPAGLTAAYELAQTGNYDITVLEADNQVGGISKTVNHQGNLIDIGGHRFFSKSQKVLNWWAIFLPILDQAAVPTAYRLIKREKKRLQILTSKAILETKVKRMLKMMKTTKI